MRTGQTSPHRKATAMAMVMVVPAPGAMKDRSDAPAH